MYFAFLSGCNKVVPRLVYVSVGLDEILSKIFGDTYFKLEQDTFVEYDGKVYHCKMDKKNWGESYGESFCHNNTCAYDLYIFENNDPVANCSQMDNALRETIG